jgi:hypothetical protein
VDRRVLQRFPKARSGTPAAISFGLFCAAALLASGIRVTGNLNGRLGFVFFLLVMVTPVFIATGAAVTVWRLPRLRSNCGVVERLLFVLAAFVVTFGAGPLAISLAVMAITHNEGSIGAAGMWALLSFVGGAALSIFGIAITFLRLALHGRPAIRP